MTDMTTWAPEFAAALKRFAEKLDALAAMSDREPELSPQKGVMRLYVESMYSQRSYLHRIFGARLPTMNDTMKTFEWSWCHVQYIIQVTGALERDLVRHSIVTSDELANEVKSLPDVTKALAHAFIADLTSNASADLPIF